MPTDHGDGFRVSKVGTAIEVLQLRPQLIQHVPVRSLIHMTKQMVPRLEG